MFSQDRQALLLWSVTLERVSWCVLRSYSISYLIATVVTRNPEEGLSVLCCNSLLQCTLNWRYYLVAPSMAHALTSQLLWAAWQEGWNIPQLLLLWLSWTFTLSTFHTFEWYYPECETLPMFRKHCHVKDAHEINSISWSQKLSKDFL